MSNNQELIMLGCFPNLDTALQAIKRLIQPVPLAQHLGEACKQICGRRQRGPAFVRGNLNGLAKVFRSLMQSSLLFIHFGNAGEAANSKEDVSTRLCGTD